MSNEGKVLKFIVLNCLLISVGTSPSILSGGVIFQEEASQGSTQINQDTLQLTRKADASILPRATATVRAFVSLYSTLCRDVKRKITPF